MDVIITFSTDNRGCLFLVVGVAAVIGVIYRIFFKKRRAGLNQMIQAGKGSTNVQSGGDAHINKDNRDKENNAKQG